MSRTVRILHVEEEENDAELAPRALSRTMTGRRQADA